MPPTKITKRRPTRGGRTRARNQVIDLLNSPKCLLDVTPKTPHYLRIAEQNAQESSLLRLPPELRYRIWTYVLSTKEDITPDRDGWDFKWNLEQIHLDVIGVCRQTYAETATLPFALGCFRFRDIDRMKQLLLRTSPEQRSATTRIKLPCYCLGEYLSWNFYDYPLREFPRLASVGVWCVRGKCNETDSTGDVVSRLRDMAGKPELKVYFLDWRVPSF